MEFWESYGLGLVFVLLAAMLILWAVSAGDGEDL